MKYIILERELHSQPTPADVLLDETLWRIAEICIAGRIASDNADGSAFHRVRVDVTELCSQAEDVMRMVIEQRCKILEKRLEADGKSEG